MGHDFANEQLRDVCSDTENKDDFYSNDEIHSIDSFETSSNVSSDKSNSFKKSTVVNNLSEYVESMHIQSNIQTDSEGNDGSDNDNDNDKPEDRVPLSWKWLMKWMRFCWG